MSLYFQPFGIKKSRLVVALLMTIFVFGSFPGGAEGEEMTLVASQQHKRMGESLIEPLQQKFRIELLILPLDQLADIVTRGKADFFVISATEIYSVMKLTRMNLAEKGRAVASADVAEKVHLTTLVRTGIKDIEDLDDKLSDKPVSLGLEHSATESHADDSIEAQRRVKGPEDFKCEDKGGRIKCQNDRFDEQAKKLLREEIKGYYVTGEVPIPSVEAVAERNELQLASIPEEVVDEMNKISLIRYIPTSIDMNDYNSGNKKVPTAGIPAVVVATDRVAENTVSEVTKILLLNNPFIPKERLPVALTAIHSFMGFHPAALKVFGKFGIELKLENR